jgi:SpoVK/Ycf46/Vps4 family AAA+-type ATPase
MAEKFDKIFIIDPENANSEVARSINLLCREEDSKLIVLEDLDKSEAYHISDLLNFIDGSVTINKAYFIGTTNYPDKLHENILSRPSRFDLFFEIGRPDTATRERLLRHFISDLSDEQYAQMAKDTKGFNASYFSEMAVLMQTTKLSVDQIIDRCNKRIKLIRTKDFKDDSEPTVGFGADED